MTPQEALRFVGEIAWFDGPMSTACWLWTGESTEDGYASIERNRKHIRVHRMVYEAVVGPIPSGLVTDHLCRVRACINPSHLEPVTRLENFRRGFSHIAMNGRKAHCKRGHPFDIPNTRLKRGGGRLHRICLACRDAWNRARSGSHA